MPLETSCSTPGMPMSSSPPPRLGSACWLGQGSAAPGRCRSRSTESCAPKPLFDDVNRPHFYDTGTLVARGNLYRSSPGDRTSTGSSYSFFDPSEHYAYTLHPTEEVEALLAKCAGPRPTLGL